MHRVQANWVLTSKGIGLKNGSEVVSTSITVSTDSLLRPTHELTRLYAGLQG